MAHSSREWFYTEPSDPDVGSEPTEAAPTAPMDWEDIGDDSNAQDMGPEDAQRAISDFLVAKALDGTYYYCDICALCWWMVLAGMTHESISQLALRPGLQSGKYKHE